MSRTVQSRPRSATPRFGVFEDPRDVVPSGGARRPPHLWERLILDALPLFGLIDDAGHRDGYEPAAAALVAEQLGVELEWSVLA